MRSPNDVIAKVESMLPELPSNDPLPPGILDGDPPEIVAFATGI